MRYNSCYFDLVIKAGKVARLKKIQRFEQFFWDNIGTKTKMENVNNIATMIEVSPSFRKLVDLLGSIRGKKVLDCGCGTGNLSAYLAMKDAYVKGFDISSEMLKAARANAKKNSISEKCNFLCSSFGVLSYRDISTGELLCLSFTLNY